MATLTFKAGASWFAPTSTTTTRSIITAIEIVDSYTITGNEIDSWDASEDNDGSIMCYVTGTVLTIAGNGSGTIKFNADQSYWLYATDGKDYFKNCTSFTGLSLIDTSNCTTLNRSFRGLEKITSLDIGHFDISNVTSLYQTFCYCKKLTSLPIANWDVSNVDTMAYTFYQTGALTLPIENWNVSNVTNLDHTFAHSASLNNLDLTKWDVSNVTNMNATFCGMKALTSLDLSTWDTSKVTCFPQFVEGCSNLEVIYGLENFDTSKSVCFAQMFRGCSKLKELDLSSFDTRNADSGTPTSDNGSTSGTTWQMITNTHKLEKITLGKYFTFEGKGVDIVPAEDIGTLPTPSATYIEEADGNWYTEDFTAYVPADVPNLTEMTYYASKKIVNDVIDTRVLDYKGLKYVLQLLNTVIDAGLDSKANAADLPNTLPNPNAITFTGAVEATYDGSQGISIEIPTGGTGGVSSWNDLTDKPNLVGRDVSGNTFLIDDTEVTAQTGAEIFNDYENNIATGNYSHAEGENTVASGYASHTEGYNTFASSWNTHAEGNSTKATNSNAHAEGQESVASGDTSHAEGRNTKASGNYSHAEGYYTEAGNYSHSEGSNTKALGAYSHAEGSYSETTGSYAHAEGYRTVAASYAHAEGGESKATGNYSHAEGNNSEASSGCSHAEGNNTKATNQNTHAEGYYTTASGLNSHAEGNNTKATNENTHAEGYNTEASGYQAHAEGSNTTASGRNSHAEGDNTKATSENAHAEGYYTTASNYQAHAEGYYSEAKGYTSHAEGCYTIASSQYQHVQGKNNIEDTENKYAHIVGNGESNSERSNAHTLDWEGNAWFAGSVESTAMILLSPNGTRFQITVGDDGVLTATEITE